MYRDAGIISNVVVANSAVIDNAGHHQYEENRRRR
jgi:hypothetical protein